jgi:hypothetical protein
MPELEDHPSYKAYCAFVGCTGREATQSVDDQHQVAPAPPGRPCFSRQNSHLFLCDSCLAFWRECAQNQVQAIWEIAVYLRDLRHHD